LKSNQLEPTKGNIPPPMVLHIDLGNQSLTSWMRENKYFIHSELIRYAEKLIENSLDEVQALMLSNLSDNVVFILKKENIYITLEKAMEYFLDIEEYEQCATIRDLLTLMENKNEKANFKISRRNQRKSKTD
jgi:hypothetical protein